jgi:hypothetical protein
MTYWDEEKTENQKEIEGYSAIPDSLVANGKFKLATKNCLLSPLSLATLSLLRIDLLQKSRW